MRQLIARVFTYALDGVANAAEGTEYMEYCKRLWAADQSVLDPTGELFQRAHALIMGRVAYESMRAHFAPGGTGTDHPWTGIFNAAPKVVFSRTLKTADWANTTIAVILYARWWQLEGWLRQLSHFVLRSTWGAVWESEINAKAAEYARRDSILHLQSPDTGDPLAYLDFSLLLRLIDDQWNQFAPFLLQREIWLGRCEEFKTIRNCIAHMRLLPPLWTIPPQ